MTLLHQCQGATRLFAKQEHQQHKGCEKDDDANRRVPVHAETMRVSYSRIDALHLPALSTLTIGSVSSVYD